ncbi:MAG: FAD-dependent oxidoreductase [Pseudomonadota bacterium]
MAAILVEAEDFDHHGGWVVDSQFASVMGSPYLLAHGLGRPVADATTLVTVPEAGAYEIWVRAKDWVPGHHPGQFKLAIDGQALNTVFGANDQDWSWQSGGRVTLPAGDVELALQDVTGFEGRCDAIYLSSDGSPPPEDANRAWRKDVLGLPAEPVDAGDFDVVVVGGGISGSAAALTAARLGLSTALIQDRPVLGGNASTEIGLMPRGAQGAILQEIGQRDENGELAAYRLLEAEPNARVFLDHRVFDVAMDGAQMEGAQMEGAKIYSVDAAEARGGQERRFTGKVFIDASGIAQLGVLAGAETHLGREGRDEYDEPYAPDEADDMHHGNTLFFRTRMADEPRPFPEVPWATEIAKDYANLSGQLVRPGVDNGPGPIADSNPATPEFRFGRKADVFPATHFWEYGQWMDPYKTGEDVRDYLMRALYGTFSNVKKLDPEQYQNLEFEWMAHVSAKGEYRRYRGDYVLSEMDIREHREFEDALIANDGSFCIHCAFERGEGKYDFRLKDWIFDNRDKEAYSVPFRCLYSRNIDNLMMAGKHISATHIAASSVKFMGNGAQHGVAVAAAASLCIELETTPRGLYQNHLQALKDKVGALTDCDHDLTSHPPERKYIPVPG